MGVQEEQDSLAKAEPVPREDSVQWEEAGGGGDGLLEEPMLWEDAGVEVKGDGVKGEAAGEEWRAFCREALFRNAGKSHREEWG